MADSNKRGPECDDERGGRGRRGHRGHRGHDGATGPTGPTGLTGPTSFPPIVAAANINSDGTFIEQTGFASVSRPLVGQYVLTLSAPLLPIPGDNGLVIQLTLSNSVGGQISYLFDPPASAGIIRVFTFDGAGVPTNKIFSITVINLAPAP